VLRQYPWPGNVRELENTLERAALLAEEGVIRSEHLPEAMRRARRWYVEQGTVQPVITMAEAEREAILRAARACQGRVTCIAEALGISRTTLWRRLKAFDIHLEEFRPRN